MSAPFFDVLSIQARDRDLRRIDTEYYIERLSKSHEQSVALEATSLGLQMEMASAQIEAWEQEAERGERTNELLGEIRGSLTELVTGVEEMTSSMKRGFESVNVTLWQGFAVVSKAVEKVVEQLEEQNRTLRIIAETLARPYETKARELREEADRWLTQGMNNTAREQQEDWTDALRLFELTAENPIGNQDYVVWFHLG